MFDELQQEYDELASGIDDLISAVAAAERDAEEARAEAAEVTSAAEVMQAMAEERAALNRAALLRRKLTEDRQRRKELAADLDRLRNDATAKQIDAARSAAGAALVRTYQVVIAERDAIYQGQRAAGAYPATSPFDKVCRALESGIAAAGGRVTPDSSGSVTVRFGDFEHVRRPIGYVSPEPKPKRQRRPILSEIEEFVRRRNVEERNDW